MPIKPVALVEDPKYPTPMILARKLFGLMALLCCAVSLAAPSSARNLQLLDHISAPVAVGDFHSHDETDGHDGAKEADHEVPAAPDDDGQNKFGHSHMPSSVSDLSRLSEPQLRPRHLVSDDAHAVADLPSLTTRGWSPPVRPPRSA